MSATREPLDGAGSTLVCVRACDGDLRAGHSYTWR